MYVHGRVHRISLSVFRLCIEVQQWWPMFGYAWSSCQNEVRLCCIAITNISSNLHPSISPIAYHFILSLFLSLCLLLFLSLPPFVCFSFPLFLSFFLSSSLFSSISFYYQESQIWELQLSECLGRQENQRLCLWQQQRSLWLLRIYLSKWWWSPHNRTGTLVAFSSLSILIFQFYFISESDGFFHCSLSSFLPFFPLLFHAF